MDIERSNMDQVAELLDRIVTRTGVFASQFVRVRQRKGGNIEWQLSSDATGVATTRGDLGIKKALFMDRRLLLNFVKGGGKSNFKLEYEDDHANGKVVLKNGRRKVIIGLAAPVSGYGNIKRLTDEDAVRLKKVDLAMVKAAAQCASKDPAFAERTCVFIDGRGSVLATDGAIFFQGRIRFKGRSFPIPLFLTEVIEHASQTAVGPRAAQVVFPLGTITQGVSGEAYKRFPAKKGKEFVAEVEKLPAVIRIKTTLLIDHLKRLAPYVAIDKKGVFGGVVIQVPKEKEKKGVYLKVNSSFGHYTDWLRADILRPGVSLTLSYDVLVRAVNALSGVSETVEFRFAKGTRTLLKSAKASVLISRPAR